MCECVYVHVAIVLLLPEPERACWPLQAKRGLVGWSCSECIVVAGSIRSMLPLSQDRGCDARVALSSGAESVEIRACHLLVVVVPGGGLLVVVPVGGSELNVRRMPLGACLLPCERLFWSVVFG